MKLGRIKCRGAARFALRLPGKLSNFICSSRSFLSHPPCQGSLEPPSTMPWSGTHSSSTCPGTPYPCVIRNGHTLLPYYLLARPRVTVSNEGFPAYDSPGDPARSGDLLETHTPRSVANMKYVLSFSSEGSAAHRSRNSSRAIVYCRDSSRHRGPR